jgi:hypothetical protein
MMLSSFGLRVVESHGQECRSGWSQKVIGAPSSIFPSDASQVTSWVRTSNAVCAAMVLLRIGVLPGWLGWVGASLAVLVGVLGVGLPAGLDVGPLDQVISLLALAWVAGLAFSLGWPLPAVAGRAGQALD